MLFYCSYVDAQQGIQPHGITYNYNEGRFFCRIGKQEDVVMRYAFTAITIVLLSASSAFAASGLRPTYKVYDATHRRSVGYTEDGVNVTAKFKKHNVIFVIRAGGSDNPDYANALGIVYAGPGCEGDAYVASFSNPGMDPDYPIMDGVLPTVSEIGKLPGAVAGEYVYGDPYAQAIPFTGNYSFFPIQFADGNPQCINYEDGIYIYGLPAIKLTIDWVPPLSTK